jgi:hypothetical protein
VHDPVKPKGNVIGIHSENRADCDDINRADCDDINRADYDDINRADEGKKPRNSSQETAQVCTKNRAALRGITNPITNPRTNPLTTEQASKQAGAYEMGVLRGCFSDYEIEVYVIPLFDALKVNHRTLKWCQFVETVAKWDREWDTDSGWIRDATEEFQRRAREGWRNGLGAFEGIVSDMLEADRVREALG